MVDLEYVIGGLKINPDKLKFEGSDLYDAKHKFVAEALDNIVSIYIAEGSCHNDILKKFNLNVEQIVGGGSCYFNGENQLVLDNFSGIYGSISEDARQKFAELVMPELKKQGSQVKGMADIPPSKHLNDFWKEKRI